MIPLTVGSLFSGIGGFELGLERTGGFKTVWQCEIDPFCQKVLEKHWPNVKRFTDIKKIGIEEEIPHVNVICGGFPCFTAGTLVETADGYRPIESLQVGCLVKTHNNRFRRVYSVMNREAPILQVEVRGSLPIEATAEHPFLIRRRIDTRPHRGPITHTFGDPEWVYAKDLDESCYVGMPLDTPDLRAWKSEAFWYLIGRWLGDGWIVNHKRTSKIPQGHRGSRVNSRVWKAIICTGHEDATDLKAKITQAGFHATESRDETATKFHISSKELVTFLEPFGKGADGKRIHGFVFKAQLEIQRALFRGWIDSDGYETDKIICGTTVSKELAMGMARIARNAYRKPVTVRLSKVPDKAMIDGRAVSQKPFYQVRVWKTSKTVWEWGDDVCWSQVRSVKNLNTIKTVYNISVEEDETYVANECIVHNCQPVSCAGKRKGKEDARWLWPEFCRVVRCVRPEWVLVENVPGLLSADSGRLFAGILRDLSESGYDAEWNIVSAASVGAPHLRKRVFIIAKMVHPMCGRRIHQESRSSPFQDSNGPDDRLSGKASVDVAHTRGEGLPQPEQEWEHGGSTAQCGRRIFERRLGGTSNGISEGIHIDRFISNEVHTCTYDAKKTHARKTLLELQSENGKEENGQTIRIDERIQEKEVLLFSMLRELDDCASGNHHETCCSEESAKSDQSKPMSEVRKDGSEIESASHGSSESVRCSDTLLKMPCGRGSEARELSDKAKSDMRDLRECISSEGLASSQNMFGKVLVGIGAQKCHEEMVSLNFWGDGWENGTPRITNDKKNRVNRLKALGNAIVPQCATYIAECVLKYQEALYTNESFAEVSTVLKMGVV